MMQLKKTARFR